MKNMIEIEGHRAVLAVDAESGLIRGEFLGLNGGADFYADSVERLAAEGRASLTVLLDICRDKGIEPFRTFSGRFNLRLDPKTHEAAVLAAAAEDKSLDEWIASAIRSAVEAA